MYRKLLIPLGGPPCDERARREGLGLVNDVHVEVTLLHVLHPEKRNLLRRENSVYQADVPG